FLGFSIELRRSRRTGRYYPHVEPGKQAAQRLRTRITRLTDRRRAVLPMDSIVMEVNRTLRGWSGYFYYRNSSNVFNGLRWHVEQRLRTHLRQRHKLCSRAQAYWKFPGPMLYSRYGLFKLPTTAAWRHR